MSTSKGVKMADDKGVNKCLMYVSMEGISQKI